VVARARLRLAEAADPAAVRLVDLLGSDDDQTAHRAATAILDRAGIGRSDRVEMTGSGGGPISVRVQAAQVVAVLTGVLNELGVDLDDHVRSVVAAHLRSMSGTARTQAIEAVLDGR